MLSDDLGHNTFAVLHLRKMNHVILLLSCVGFALCGSLSNEYLPPNTGVRSGQSSTAFGANNRDALSTYSPASRSSNSGSAFGHSSAPSPQYGAPASPAGTRQYSAPQQYNSPAAPRQEYGTPSQFGGLSSGRSSISSAPQFRSTFPQTQYGAPTQYSAPQQDSRGSAPQQGYGAPSQIGVSSFGPKTSFAPRTQYGASSSSRQYLAPQSYSSPASTAREYGTPSHQFGASSSGPSKSLSAGPQFKSQSLPQSQYGAPSVAGQQRNGGFGSFPSQSVSQFGGQSRGISSQYGAPQQSYGAPQGVQSSASFRAGPQFGGFAPSQGGVSSGYRPATRISGTVQDSNGGYVY